MKVRDRVIRHPRQTGTGRGIGSWESKDSTSPLIAMAETAA
jgi:hypothetical protein